MAFSHFHVRFVNNLGLIMALYKMQEIVEFLDERFLNNSDSIRKCKEEGAVSLLRYSFNSYTVSAVLKTVSHIKTEMKNIIENDQVIKELKGYELLIGDFIAIEGKIEELEKLNLD